VQRKVFVKITDAENLDEKDKFLFQKYKNSLIQAKALIERLDENHETLSKTLRQAKKGKKNRAILNALLEGDNFARKYSLKSARREKAFDADRDKLLPIINSQRLENLELTASKPAYPKYSNTEIKKTFVDFSEE
jgi:hypothetical protein